MNAKLLGRWGEAQAARYLREKKYNIIGAGFYTRFGEIDIIAKKQDLIIFVEVKLRKDDKFASGRESVTYAKQRRIKETAAIWLERNECELAVRFDVIEIYTQNQKDAEKVVINHIENAF